MAEGWKQIWQDILNAVRGANPDAQTPDPAAHPVSPSVEPEDQAAVDVLDTDTLDAPVIIKTVDETASPSINETDNTIEPYVEPVTQPVARPRRVWLGRLGRTALYFVMGIILLAAMWFTGGYRLAPNAYLWWLRLTAPKPPAADVVVSFNGGQLTIGDVEAHLKLLVPEDEYQAAARSPEMLVAVAKNMVVDELVRSWAATRKPEQDDTFSHTMQHINENINLESLATQLHEGKIQVTESEIQAYYQANKTQFGDQTLDQVREQIRETFIAEREQGYIKDYIQRLKDNASITRNFDLLDVPAPAEDDLRRYYDANLEQFKLPRQAVVDEMQFTITGDETAARKNADDALLKVRSGASFDEVAKTIVPTSIQNGATVPEGTRDPAWDAAVFALTPGQLGSVFRAGDSFYIVRLNQLQPARTKSLGEVRSEVLDVVQQQKADEWFDGNASKTLVMLKGKQYTLGQFYQEYKEIPVSTMAQYAGAAGMKKLAESLIERLLLVEDTYDQLLDSQNKPMAEEARLEVIKQMMHQEEVDDKIQVTDEEIQKYYDENSSLMSIPPKTRIRYIRIGLGQTEDEQKAARARADEAYKKLVPGFFQQGTDFAQVAQEYSEDPETATKGGELPDWISESDDVFNEIKAHPLHQAAAALQPGDISSPSESGDSLYIVQVIERTEAEKLPFEQAKSYIKEILTERKHEEQLTQLGENLLRQANVVIYNTVLLDYFDKLATPVAP